MKSLFVFLFFAGMFGTVVLLYPVAKAIGDYLATRIKLFLYRDMGRA